MANLPSCPNHREGACERSEIVFAGESYSHWSFICRCCHLYWVVSKPHERDRAVYEKYVKELARATEADKAHSRQPKRFVGGMA